MTARPPGRPPRPAVSAQRWESLTFLHWPVDPAVVQGWLPPGLTVDTLDGTTWLGVVPFVMADVRVPPLPALGAWSTFPELNVRVYVRDRSGQTGIWFCGLWATRRAFVAATRAAGLPYHSAHADVSTGGPAAHVVPPGAASRVPSVVRYAFVAVGGTGPFRLRHEHPGLRSGRFAAVVRAHRGGDPGAEAGASSDLEAWLTGRWNAYGVRAGVLWRFPVHHEPWTLGRGALDALDTDLPGRLGLPDPAGPPLVHVAGPVHARFGIPHRVP